MQTIHPWSKAWRFSFLIYCCAVVFVLSACGRAANAPENDPPGALVRLQRVDNMPLPGDFTVFSSGNLQLYVDSRGALRKSVALEDLAGLQAALADPAIASLSSVYPADLPAGAGDQLTIYGSARRVIRYNPRVPDLPPALQHLIDQVLQLRGRF